MKYYAVSVNYNKKLLQSGIEYTEKIEVHELDYEPISYKFVSLFSGESAKEHALRFAELLKTSQKTYLKQLINVYKTNTNLMSNVSKKETKIVLNPLPKSKK